MKQGSTGYGLFETAHEPFLPLVLAAEHSRNLSLGTSIAVAFARSPAVLAYTAWDLARYSKGRFIMGLGTQVKGHNERRFGVKWERPVEKMREVILAFEGHLGLLAKSHQAELSGRVFQADFDDSILQSAAT